MVTLDKYARDKYPLAIESPIASPGFLDWFTPAQNRTSAPAFRIEQQFTEPSYPNATYIFAYKKQEWKHRNILGYISSWQSFTKFSTRPRHCTPSSMYRWALCRRSKNTVIWCTASRNVNQGFRNNNCWCGCLFQN